MDYSSIFIYWFNTRERAYVVVGICLVIFCLINKDIRKSLLNVLKLVFTWIIGRALLFLLIYSVLIVWLLYSNNIWEVSYLTITLIWFIFTACDIFFNIMSYTKDPSLFKSLVYKQFWITAIVWFWVNFFTFPLRYEIIIICVVILLSMVIAWFTYIKENKNEKFAWYFENILNFVLLFVAISWLFKILINYQEFFTFDNLLIYLIPVLLTVFVVPFFYLLCLYILSVLSEKKINSQKIITEGVVARVNEPFLF